MKAETIDSLMKAARRVWRERPGPELAAPTGLAFRLSKLAKRGDPALVWQRTCWASLAAAEGIALLVQFEVRRAGLENGAAAELWLEMEVP